LEKALKRKATAFTLTELLIVLVIVVALSLVLLPVALSAKAAGARAVCQSNLHQAYSSMELYMQDYDDHFTPVNYQPGERPDPTTDRTWVQLLLPYIRSFAIFKCPGDYGFRARSDTSFDEDLVPDDTYQRYYTASLRSDIGFNAIYLSPIVKDLDNKWKPNPRTGTDVGEPSKTIMFVDSLFNRDVDGSPVGGGNWVVFPPCRYSTSPAGNQIDTFSAPNIGQVYTGEVTGWSDQQNSGLLYGKAWPWHAGRMNVVRADGSVSNIRPIELGNGCDVQADWKGLISNPAKYMWSITD